VTKALNLNIASLLNKSKMFFAKHFPSLVKRHSKQKPAVDEWKAEGHSRLFF